MVMLLQVAMASSLDPKELGSDWELVSYRHE